MVLCGGASALGLVHKALLLQVLLLAALFKCGLKLVEARLCRLDRAFAKVTQHA